MKRFNVVTSVPKQMRDRGFVAYVNDSTHPDGGGSCSMSWHLSLIDADRVAAAMNKTVSPVYRFDLVCPRCSKTSETTSDKWEPAPHVNCGDCLMNDVQIIQLKVVAVRQEA